MKKFLKFSTLAAFLFITMSSRANESNMTLVNGNDAKSLVFVMSYLSSEVNIKLLDEYDRTIYTETTFDASYLKKFNLKNLENGTYYFKVESSSESVVYTLNVKNTGVTILEKEQNITKHVLRKEGNKVYLNLMNNDLSRVSMKVLNGYNEEIFHKSVKGELVLGEVFNFDKAVKDSYTVEVKDGNETYSQKIEVL